MASFASISSVLASDQAFVADIDLTLDRQLKSLDLAIGGKTFDAASARMALTLAHVGKIASSLKRVSDATDDYQETVAEIKRKAAAAEQQLAEASMELSKTYMHSTTSPPSQYEVDRRNKAYAEAQSDYDDATSTLSKMAQLRQAADDKRIAAIGASAYELVDVELLSRFPTDRRDLLHTEAYEYHYSHDVAGSEDFSPEEAMRLFQENPGEIFPFDIEGATSFVDGETIGSDARLGDSLVRQRVRPVWS